MNNVNLFWTLLCFQGSWNESLHNIFFSIYCELVSKTNWHCFIMFGFITKSLDLRMYLENLEVNASSSPHHIFWGIGKWCKRTDISFLSFCNSCRKEIIKFFPAWNIMTLSLKLLIVNLLCEVCLFFVFSIFFHVFWDSNVKGNHDF